MAAKKVTTQKAAKWSKADDKALAEAQGRAREGHVDEVMPLLESAAERGRASALYSLAEIHAWRGEWSRSLDRLLAFGPIEAEVYGANTKRDAAGLAWRAAEETGRWADASALLALLDENAVGGLLYRSLKELFDGAGNGPAPTLAGSVDTPEQRRAKVDRAKEKGEAFGIVMFAKEDPAFDDDVLTHFAAALPKLRWEYVLKALPAFIRAGRHAEAFAALQAKRPEWLTAVACQIASAQLLWDPGLRPMMTAERCAALLNRAPG